MFCSQMEAHLEPGGEISTTFAQIEVMAEA